MGCRKLQYYFRDGVNSDSAAHFEYSPFGKTTVASGTIPNRFAFRFSSEYHDSETNLVYYNYRYYSPELGRWLSRDPIGERGGGYNLYGMVSNGVMNWWDRLGLAIHAKYINGLDAYEAMIEQHIHMTADQLTRVTLRSGFTVWYEDDGKCECIDNHGNKTKGNVILVQKLYEKSSWWSSPSWVVDSGGHSYTHTCSNGHTSTYQPAYTDPKSYTGADSGAHGTLPGSYIDSPDNEQTIRVEAYCRCECKDDKLIETAYFKYVHDGPIGQPLDVDDNPPK